MRAALFEDPEGLRFGTQFDAYEQQNFRAGTGSPPGQWTRSGGAGTDPRVDRAIGGFWHGIANDGPTWTGRGTSANNTRFSRIAITFKARADCGTFSDETWTATASGGVDTAVIDLTFECDGCK
jgi:hypothetical protein